MVVGWFICEESLSMDIKSRGIVYGVRDWLDWPCDTLRPQVWRCADVDGQLGAHIMLQQRRVPGHDVPALRPRRPQWRQTTSWSRLHPVVGCRTQTPWPAILGDVQRIQGGQLRPEAVPHYRDAHLLVLVRIQQFLHVSYQWILAFPPSRGTTLNRKHEVQ